MPRFLITLIALLTIAGVAVGKTRVPRHYTTGRQFMSTRTFTNGNVSSTIKECMTVGRVLPPNRKYAVLEYTVVKEDHSLPDGTLARYDSCVFPILFGLTDTVTEDKMNDAVFHNACALWGVQDSLTATQALELAMQNDYYCTGYAVTIWDSALISMQLLSYYEGAYPNDLPLYFNFNAATGNLLTLDSIVAPEQMPRFQKLLRGKLKHILNAYRPDLARQLRTGDIDRESYDYCIGATRGDGMGTFDPRTFTVSPDTIKVELDWDFMHALQALAPESEIALPKKELKGMLKKEYE